MKPKENRIAWCGVWSAGHNNVRYQELLPRLRNVDRYPVRLHRVRWVRGLQRRILYPCLAFLLRVRYPILFTTDPRLARLFPGHVICDLDDPADLESEVAIFSRSNVIGVIAASDAIRARLAQAGLRKPVQVVPQGVSVETLNEREAERLRRTLHTLPQEVVVGLNQPYSYLRRELRNPRVAAMYSIDDLLGAMELVTARAPQTVLCLMGQASPGVQAYSQEHPWLHLTGYQPHAAVLNFVSGFDIGVYPRSGDAQGAASIKILEYMACGVPVVGLAVGEMEVVRESGAGKVVQNWPEFVAEVLRLVGDAGLRRELGDRGRTYVQRFSWERLAGSCEQLLDGMASASSPVHAGP
jgi:glycosyltransferase involved in cell wall biosynthesis